MTNGDGRDAALGAESCLLTMRRCLQPDPPTGGFFYDGNPCPW